MSEAASELQPTLRQIGGWLTIIGVAGLGLGLSGLVMIFAGPALGLTWYGIFLILLGLIQLGELLRRLSLAGRTVRAILALVYVACGLTLVVAPATVGALELLVAVLFTAAGAFRIVWAFAWPTWSRAWGLAAGVASIALGLLMMVGWPTSAMWVLGAAVAFDLAVYGLSAMLLGWVLWH